MNRKRKPKKKKSNAQALDLSPLLSAFKFFATGLAIINALTQDEPAEEKQIDNIQDADAEIISTEIKK